MNGRTMVLLFSNSTLLAVFVSDLFNKRHYVEPQSRFYSEACLPVISIYGHV